MSVLARAARQIFAGQTALALRYEFGGHLEKSAT